MTSVAETATAGAPAPANAAPSPIKASNTSIHSNSRTSIVLSHPPVQRGRLGNLSPEQEHALAEFKRQLVEAGQFEEDWMTDHLLLRFLRARRFDLAKTMLMFQKFLKWRVEFQVEDIYKNFVYTEKPKVSAVYPRYYHKNDKDGRPIYIEHFGSVNYSAMFKATTEKRFMQNHVLEFERFLRQRLLAVSYRAGHHIEQSCTILDLKNVALTQFPQVRSVVSAVSEISQDYYPETLGRMYIINSPRLFTTVWSVVKMFLDEVTVNKIHILGYDYQSTLLEHIPAENLPKEFGGQCECPGGCRMSDIGVWSDMTEEDWAKARKFEDEEVKRLWDMQKHLHDHDGHDHAHGHDHKTGHAHAHE